MPVFDRTGRANVGHALETTKLADCNPHGQWIEWLAV